MPDSPIPCALHDYLEIACLYHYTVRLTLKNGKVFDGIAADTLTSPEKREYLVIDSGQKQQIATGQIEKLQVLTPQAKFSEVFFGSSTIDAC